MTIKRHGNQSEEQTIQMLFMEEILKTKFWKIKDVVEEQGEVVIKGKVISLETEEKSRVTRQ